MSKVVAGFSMSLDGFVADPAGVRLAPALWLRRVGRLVETVGRSRPVIGAGPGPSACCRRAVRQSPWHDASPEAWVGSPMHPGGQVLLARVPLVAVVQADREAGG